MTDFETALDDCLKRLATGKESVNDCLARYPKFADDLRPLLSAALHVGRIAEVQPSQEFKAETRVQLDAHMRANPRRRSPVPAVHAQAAPGFFASPFFRMAAVATALLVALLLAGTAYAQSALPGDALYGWKLASENLVRVFSPARVDMWLAQRRANEVLAVRNDPARLAIAWAQYRLVMDRLLAYDDPRYDDEIQLLLKDQWDTFVNLGVPLPVGTSALPALPTLTPTPQPTDTLLPGGLPTLTLPPVLTTPTPGATGVSSPTPTDIITLPTLPSLATNTPRPTRTPQPTNTPRPILCIGPSCP